MPRHAEHLDRLKDRYDLLEPLGEGSQGTTRLARDLDRDEQVVVKELDLEHDETWRAIELFERERHALSTLDHPGIPDYVDGVQLEGREGPRFFLVCEYVEGRTLDARIEAVESTSEAEVRELLVDVLEVLDYLHGREPPILHRDVKPANVLERPDGSHVLIDFGTIESMADEVGGESVAVGTAGYTAPEQMAGRAEPASDLYGLGMTALTMLSARDASPRGGGRLRDELDISPALADLLEAMTSPDLEARPGSAAEVLERLEVAGTG
jgi:serine/threonine protein kinase